MSDPDDNVIYPPDFDFTVGDSGGRPKSKKVTWAKSNPQVMADWFAGKVSEDGQHGTTTIAIPPSMNNMICELRDKYEFFKKNADVNRTLMQMGLQWIADNFECPDLQKKLECHLNHDKERMRAVGFKAKEDRLKKFKEDVEIYLQAGQFTSMRQNMESLRRDLDDFEGTLQTMAEGLVALSETYLKGH